MLELACGTGRVLLPIAQQGLRIDGVDSSPAMLDQLRQKLERQPQPVRELAAISLGDLRSYRSERKYALVIIPFRPLQHMYTVEDQLAALNTAAFHLGSGGLLAFDVFYPRFESLLAGLGEARLELQWTRNNDPTTTILRYLRKESVDKINQNFSAQYVAKECLLCIMKHSRHYASSGTMRSSQRTLGASPAKTRLPGAHGLPP